MRAFPGRQDLPPQLAHEAADAIPDGLGRARRSIEPVELHVLDGIVERRRLIRFDVLVRAGEADEEIPMGGEPVQTIGVLPGALGAAGVITHIASRKYRGASIASAAAFKFAASMSFTKDRQ